MANENVTHHTTSAQKLFEKIQNMNFKLYIYTKKKKLFNCSYTYSSVCSNSPLIFHFLIKYFVLCQVIWMEEPINTILIKKFEKSLKHFPENQIKMLLKTILFLKNKQ